MSSSPFDRLFQGELETHLKTETYMKIEIAPLGYQHVLEKRVRKVFREYLLKHGKDPEKWKMMGMYKPFEKVMILGLGCIEDEMISTINHEFIHHIINLLLGFRASSELDFLIANATKKEYDSFTMIDGKVVF